MNRTLLDSSIIPANTTGKPSFAVVGAGVVGLCVALEALRQGYAVTLLDSNEPGTAASYGNAGYLATELIDPLATPESVRSAPKLCLDPDGPVCVPWKYLRNSIPWYAKFLAASNTANAQQGTQALSALNQLSVAAWQRLLTDIDATDQIIKVGNLVVWENPEKKADAHALIERMATFGLTCEYVEGQRLADLEPELSQQLSHAVFFPDAYRLSDPYAVCQTLYNTFIERGGQFFQQKVMGLEAHHKAIQIYLEDQKAYPFDQVTVCAGAWSTELLKQVGITVPLEAERGYQLTFPEKNQQHLNHMVLSADRRFVMSPLDSGLRVVGMSEIGGTSLAPIKKRYAVLNKHTKALLPEAYSKGKEAPTEWMGHRPTLPDSLPVIDQHPTFSRLSFAFGHQHLGITQAAITAELLLQKIQNEPTLLSLNAFKVDRF